MSENKERDEMILSLMEIGYDPLSLDAMETEEIAQILKNISEASEIKTIEGTFRPREHQLRVAQHMRERRGLIAIHDLGSGKTLSAIIAINCVLMEHKSAVVHIIVPKTILPNFQKELDFYFSLPTESFIELVDCPSLPIADFRNRITLTTPQKYAKKSDDENMKNVFLIVDEAHNLRNKGKTNNKLIEFAKRALKVLLLTGTPLKNRETDIVPLISIIDGKKKSISEDYFKSKILHDPIAFRKYFGGKLSVYHAIDDPNYPRRVDVPIVKLVMPEQYYHDYYLIQNSMANQHIVDLYGDPTKYSVFYNALRRATNGLNGIDSPKVQWAYRYAAFEASKGRKTIIYSAFKDSGIYLISKMLKKSSVGHVFITGDISLKQRKEAMRLYNNGDVSVMLLSKAGAEGIDLKRSANIILTESGWNVSEEEQVIARAIRYMSHEGLPEEQRVVKVIRLFLVKPASKYKNDDQPDAIDEIMFKSAYMKKEPKLIEMMEKLEEVSIENLPYDMIDSDVPYGSKQETDDAFLLADDLNAPTKIKKTKKKKAGWWSDFIKGIF